MLRRLAVGGMGEIFLARQAIAGTRRLVVLKRLLPQAAEDPRRRAMLIDEARIAASLTHPNIVGVHELGEDDDGQFIAMEYVAGLDASRLITAGLPVALGAYIAAEVARALDHVHTAHDSEGAALHIVHRDVSPSNVIVAYRGDVKLMDFGVARAANRDQHTTDGSLRGKLAYMPPEQIEGEALDARADVFALGAVLWELTLQRRLFEAPSELELLRVVLEQPIPRPRTLAPSYPPALEALVMAALERRRDARLASAAELHAGLRAFLRAQPVEREDVAAWLATRFAGDAAAADALSREHTGRALRDHIATAPLAQPVPPGSREAASDASPPASLAARASTGARSPASRSPRIARALLGATLAAALVAAAWRQRASPTNDSAQARVAEPAPQPSAPRTPLAAALANGGGPPAPSPPAAAPPRAATATRPAAPAAASPPRRRAAASTIPAAPAPIAPAPVAPALVTIGLAVRGPHADVRLTAPPGAQCTSEWLATRCTLAAGPHEVELAVSGGSTFRASLVVPERAAKCWVDLAAHVIRCD